MRPPVVVPLHPVANDSPGVLKCLKRVLPDTFLLETAKEPFDDPVLFWRIGRDEFLLQPIVSTGLAKSAFLENQPVITA
jgi:hypothetical protein